jgi:uncharacterized membrane protein
MIIIYDAVLYEDVLRVKYAGRDKSMKKSHNILSRSLVGAFCTSLVVFFLFTTVFVGNLGPIPALIYSPIAFIASFFVFLSIETLLVRQSRKSRKKVYLVVFVICLAPIVIYMGINHRDFTPAGRMEHAPPLTEEETLLLQSTRLNFRVGVVNPRRPPVYTRSLIRDLKQTCLFDEVGVFSELETADVLATIKGVYRDDKKGQRFIFHDPKYSSGVEIEVFYKPNPVMILGSIMGERKQYIDRLSVQLIEASQTLSGQSQSITKGSLNAEPDERLGCRKK